MKKGASYLVMIDYILFSIYMNDLPLLLKNTEVDIYADDTTIWSSGTNCTDIQNTLNNSLFKGYPKAARLQLKFISIISN